MALFDAAVVQGVPVQRKTPDEQADLDALTVQALGLSQPLTSLTLSNPQLLAIHQITAQKKNILSLDKGMGKTITYLVAANQVGAERIIIMCTKNAMPAQRREILRHFPEWADKFAFVLGTRNQRREIWNNPRYSIFITTPATFQADAGLRKGGKSSRDNILPSWAFAADCIIEDEFHRYMRNRTSGMFDMQKSTVFNPSYLFLSSGSSVSKGPQDVWPALHLIKKAQFSSYWAYVNKYCLIQENGFGKEIIGAQNVESWRRNISPHMFHRRKSGKDYPLKIREFLETSMTPMQRRIHDQLKNELLAEIPELDYMTLARTTLDALYKLRLLLICPKALDERLDYGGGLEAILEDVQDGELSHFVISVPLKKPIPWVRQFFENAGFRSYTLTGDDALSPDELDARIGQWTKTGGVMIQTHKYAQSYELLAAKNVYSLGYEWDPEDNTQAEDRLHRLSAAKDEPINCWYVKCRGSYDEDAMDIVLQKAHNTRVLFGD